MLLMLLLAVFGVGVCTGAVLRGGQNRADWRKWQRELDTREPDGLPHYRRTL